MITKTIQLIDFVKPKFSLQAMSQDPKPHKNKELKKFPSQSQKQTLLFRVSPFLKEDLGMAGFEFSFHCSFIHHHELS